MAASQPAFSEAESWQDQPLDASHSPDATLADWLAERGLLTGRLRACCGEHFSMRVLRDSAGSGSAGLHREVFLCCGTRLCVYAVTDVPPETLARHDWLARLGDEPLGEALQSRADVSRSEFRYALLQPASLPPEAGVRQPVWARRSEFSIGSDTLTVTEVFLEALRDCCEGK